MTKKRTGDTWMPADEYGRRLPRFTVNLLVRDLARFLAFYKEVLGARERYSDADFAALELNGLEFMLHADHTYDRSEEHTSELQSLAYLVCRLLLEKKKKIKQQNLLVLEVCQKRKRPRRQS